MGAATARLSGMRLHYPKSLRVSTSSIPRSCQVTFFMGASGGGKRDNLSSQNFFVVHLFGGLHPRGRNRGRTLQIRAHIRNLCESSGV